MESLTAFVAHGSSSVNLENEFLHVTSTCFIVLELDFNFSIAKIFSYDLPVSFWTLFTFSSKPWSFINSLICRPTKISSFILASLILGKFLFKYRKTGVWCAREEDIRFEDLQVTEKFFCRSIKLLSSHYFLTKWFLPSILSQSHRKPKGPNKSAIAFKFPHIFQECRWYYIFDNKLFIFAYFSFIWGAYTREILDFSIPIQRSTFKLSLEESINLSLNSLSN